MTISTQVEPKSSGAAGAEIKKAALPPPQRNADGTPCAPPVAPPPFTVNDIRSAIPAHCFERSNATSFKHLFTDMAMIAVFVYAATFIQYAPFWARCLLWPLYWAAAGLVGTGLWVLAHECGHQAFSASQTINDTVGWIVHSALLVPYFSWKYSHKLHHAQTCSMEHDEVFVPATRSDFLKQGIEVINDSPLSNTLYIVIMLLFGWPAYLISNAAGPVKHRDQPHNSHFHPASSLFRDRERLWVAVSDVGILFALAGLAYAVAVFGAGNVAFFYGVPYLIVNAHLVLVTYLQHSDVYIPHYRAGAFTWLRGALSTVDRSFSAIHDVTMHHITDTHVLHHMFHEIPFYHAQEATEAIKTVLGPYYLHDPTPVHKALYRSFKECRFVEDEGDILMFKNAADYAAGAKKAA